MRNERVAANNAIQERPEALKNKPAKLAALNKVLNYKSGAMACSASVCVGGDDGGKRHRFAFV